MKVRSPWLVWLLAWNSLCLSIVVCWTRSCATARGFSLASWFHELHLCYCVFLLTGLSLRVACSVGKACSVFNVSASFSHMFCKRFLHLGVPLSYYLLSSKTAENSSCQMRSEVCNHLTRLLLDVFGWVLLREFFWICLAAISDSWSNDTWQLNENHLCPNRLARALCIAAICMMNTCSPSVAETTYQHCLFGGRSKHQKHIRNHSTQIFRCKDGPLCSCLHALFTHFADPFSHLPLTIHASNRISVVLERAGRLLKCCCLPSVWPLGMCINCWLPAFISSVGGQGHLCCLFTASVLHDIKLPSSSPSHEAH